MGHQTASSAETDFDDFGACLKFLRRRARLTQRELAAAVGYSPEHLSRLESGQRVPDPATVAARFVSELRLSREPAVAAQLVQLAERAHRRTPVTAVTVPAAVPAPVTPLVGRTQELAAITEWMDDPASRLLTIVGLGGSGKTRLAISAATKSGLSDGAVLVPLEAVTSATQILPALHDALQLPPGASVTEYLADKELLLVMDNLEQLAPEAIVISQLLAAAPRVKVLATSRERLQLYGEGVLDLGGLEVTDSLGTASPAVTLFAGTARRLWPALQSTPDDDKEMVRICAAVGGLPLAIELAAGWCRSMSLAEIADRVERAPVHLSSPLRDRPIRHRNLESIFAQSWQLLGPDEQQTLLAAATFRGGFTREAIESLYSPAAELLPALIDRALVSRGLAGRHLLHPLVREYATDRARRAGRYAGLRDRHADHFLRWASTAERHLDDPDQRVWLAMMEDEHDNLRAALEHLIASQPAAAAQMCLALVGFWSVHGHYTEGRRWLTTVLSGPTDAVQRARLLSGLGELAWLQVDFDAAEAAVSEALRLHRQLDAQEWVGAALHRLGAIAGHQVDFDRAEQLYQEALAIKVTLPDDLSVAKTQMNLAITAMHKGDLEQAHELHQRALAVFRDHSHDHFVSMALINLGDLSIYRDEINEAEHQYGEALELLSELGDQLRIASGLDGLARAAAARGQFHRAVKLVGAAEALRERYATVLSPSDRADLDGALSRARAGLTPTEFEEARAAGRALRARESVEYARSPESPAQG